MRVDRINKPQIKKKISSAFLSSIRGEILYTTWTKKGILTLWWQKISLYNLNVVSWFIQIPNLWEDNYFLSIFLQ